MIEHSSFNKLVGSTLANYRLEQLIERDKLGPVFLARSTSASPQSTGRDQSGPYAENTTATYRLRILDISADLKAEERIIYLGRFQQEANQVAALRHPAILP